MIKMIRDKQILVRLTKIELEQLEKVAKEQSRTKSALLRKALLQLIENESK